MDSRLQIELDGLLAMAGNNGQMRRGLVNYWIRRMENVVKAANEYEFHNNELSELRRSLHQEFNVVIFHVPAARRGAARQKRDDVMMEIHAYLPILLGQQEVSPPPRQKPLKAADYYPKTVGDRVLSCGEGKQLGQPGRTVTKKVHAVSTFPEGVRFTQVTAGGVHSLVLAVDGTVYSCGMNKTSTVPVKGLEAEGSTDQFTPIPIPPAISKLGQVMQVCAGASFSAALTIQGSVFAWGNLRDASGLMSQHEKLRDMQKDPTVIFHHGVTKIVKIAAGENHLVMLSRDGEVLTFGDCAMGQLGRTGKDTGRLLHTQMVSERGLKVAVYGMTDGQRRFLHFDNVFAGGFWSMARTTGGEIYAWGLNNFDQLGIDGPPQNGGAPNGGDTGTDAIKRVCRPTLAPAFPSDSHFTHIAGVHHVVCRDKKGSIYAMGRNIDNALGLGTWQGQEDKKWRYDTLQKVRLPNEAERAVGADASLDASVVWTDQGNVYAFGYDTVGQLGLGLIEDDEKMVSTPQQLRSDHLDGYRVLQASIGDNHTLFLAASSSTQVKQAEAANGGGHRSRTDG